MRESENTYINMDNESVLHDVFSRYYHGLCFYAKRMLRDKDVVAKDIVQEVFISVWKKKLTFNNVYSLKAYLYSSTYHSCLDTIKLAGIHERHHRHILDETTRRGLDELQFLNDRIESETLAEIFRAIDQLPKQCCKIFKMSYIDGLSVEEVAAELEISINTVKTQRARAKKLLKENLKTLYAILAMMFFS